MTVATLAVPQPVADGLFAVFELRLLVTARAFETSMLPFEWIARELLVVEGVDREGLVVVAGVAFVTWLGETELPAVRRAVAAGAVARKAAIARPLAGLAIFSRGLMTRDARRPRVSTDQGPGAVVDIRVVPSGRAVTVATAPLGHFARELLAMRVLVAVSAAGSVQPPIQARALSPMAPRTGDRLVATFEREGCGRMLLNPEECGREAIFVVTLSARAPRTLGELALMRIAMTIHAALEA